MNIQLRISQSVFDNNRETIVAPVTGNTVVECIEYVIKQQPFLREAIFAPDGSLLPKNMVFINNNYMPDEPLVKPVNDEDVIDIIKNTGG